MYTYDDIIKKKEKQSPIMTAPKNTWQRRAEEISSSLKSGENKNLYNSQVVKVPKTDVSAKSPVNAVATTDDFLEGFNYYLNEEKQEKKALQERNEGFARSRANAAKSNWVSDKVNEDSIKTDEEDEFLAGFNEVTDELGYKKKNPQKEVGKTNKDKILDGISTALTAASFIPGVDTVTNLLSIPVDLLRGDYISAGLDLAGAIPFVGEIADAARTARTADRIIDGTRAVDVLSDGARLADTALDTVKVAGDAADNVKVVDKSTDALNSADTAADAGKAADILEDIDNAVDFTSFPKTIHSGRQGKHIVGHNNYVSGKSIVTTSTEKLQELIKQHSGAGISIGKNKEVVDFGEVIGKYVDPMTGKTYDTTTGTIHYSKQGVHIVPRKPKNWRG